MPTVLLEQDSLGIWSCMPCPAHSPPVPQPSAAQQPVPHLPLGIPGVWGARVVLPSTPGLDAMSRSLWCCTGPCCGVSCFLSARGHVCFRLFLSCSAAVTCRSPTLTPTAGSWGTTSSGLALSRCRVSQELASGRAASEPRIPMASWAVIWLSPDYRATNALIKTSLICLKEPVCSNPIKAM